MPTMSKVDSTVSKQWANRPDDQRFLTIESLKNAVLARRQQSWTTKPHPQNLRVIATDNNGIAVKTYDRNGDEQLLAPTNHAFTQLSQLANAPAGYLRDLPSELAAINLQWGLDHNPQREDIMMLGRTNGHHALRAITSPKYGRIWDEQVVRAVEGINQNGRWQVPSASYSGTDPLRATTLYASDRDVFMFLVDPNNPINVDGETLFRGFYTWNSETGSCTFGLSTFLYRYVCDNRMIWGQSDVKELRIRHSRNAPGRFMSEAVYYLNRYADSATDKVIAEVKKAKNMELPLKKDQTIEEWLRGRGFTKTESSGAVNAAKTEEGKASSLWDIINGVTAYARKSITHTNDRVDLEMRAGKLMDMVASN